jgi:hypothetical protein
MDTSRRNSVYHFVTDSSLVNNISGKDTIREKQMEAKLKAVIQQYNHAIIHNEMKPIQP